jgi:broad specificity phosphatase PhoE
LIDRELDLLGQQGLLPAFPPALREAEGEYALIYDSPLSRAARAEEASGLNRSLQTVLEIVKNTGNAEPLDHFDWDTITPELNEIHGVPMRWVRSAESIEKIRAGRAQQMQEQAAAQAAPGAAGILSSAAKIAKA